MFNYTMAHLRWGVVLNETETVTKRRNWRTVNNRFVECGDGASTRILTRKKLHIEIDIAWCWTAAQLIVIFILWACDTITTTVLNIPINVVSCLQIVSILKPKQINIQQHLTLTYLVKLVVVVRYQLWFSYTLGQHYFKFCIMSCLWTNLRCLVICMKFSCYTRLFPSTNTVTARIQQNLN